MKFIDILKKHLPQDKIDTFLQRGRIIHLDNYSAGFSFILSVSQEDIETDEVTYNELNILLHNLDNRKIPELRALPDALTTDIRAEAVSALSKMSGQAEPDTNPSIQLR